MDKEFEAARSSRLFLSIVNKGGTNAARRVRIRLQEGRAGVSDAAWLGAEGATAVCIHRVYRKYAE